MASMKKHGHKKNNKRPRLTKGRSMSMSPKNAGLHRRQCRNKHPLKKTINMRMETCSDCRAKVAKNGMIYSCKNCRFHVCKVCYSKPACNNGHSLTTTRASKNGILCSNNQCNYRAIKGLTMKHCRLCKYYLCLGCYGCETCPGNHGLRLSRPSKLKLKDNNNTSGNNNDNTEMKTAGNTGHSSHHSSNNKKRPSSSSNKNNSNNKDNSIITCNKCSRVFDKPNIPLFLCHECKYYLCGDCYQPSILFHRKRKEKLQKQQKKQIQQQQQSMNINIIAPQAKVDANGNTSVTTTNNNNNNQNGNMNMNMNINGNGNNINVNMNSVAVSSVAPLAPVAPSAVGTSVGSVSAPPVVASVTNIIDDEKMQAVNDSNVTIMADNYYWGTDDESTPNGNNGNNKLTPTGGHSGSKSDTMLDELQELQEPKELTRIPSIATECIICMETDKTMAFQPCGHYIACENCATLMKLEGKCPICSANILGLFRIFE